MTNPYRERIIADTIAALKAQGLVVFAPKGVSPPDGYLPLEKFMFESRREDVD